MQIYKRDRSPYWWCEFSIDGQKIRMSTKRVLSDVQGANRFLAQEYQRRVNQVQFGQKEEITLTEAMERTLKTVSGKTLESYTTSMRRWLGLGTFDRPDHWALDGAMQLSRLSQNQLDDHLLERAEEGLKPNSIIIEVRFMQRVCNLMSKRFSVNRDLEFNKPKPFKKSRWLTQAEEGAVSMGLLVKAGHPSYDKAHALMVFLADTGVRLGEALSLDWTDIDLTRGTMEVYRGKTKNLSMVPISDRVADYLRKVHNQKQPFMDMSRAVRLLRREIDVQCNTNPRIVAQRGKATIHTLRDTYATRLVSDGMSLHKVSKLLGHTSPTQSAKYAQLEAHDVMSEAKEILNRRTA
jgi:integrase